MSFLSSAWTTNSIPHLNPPPRSGGGACLVIPGRRAATSPESITAIPRARSQRWSCMLSEYGFRVLGLRPSPGMTLSPPPRDHVALVEKPQPAALAQHRTRCVDIAVADFGEPVVLDLRHIDRRVPRREQRRGADRLGDFRRQRVHDVFEQRAIVGIGVEIELAAGGAELVLDRFEDVVAIVD